MYRFIMISVLVAGCGAGGDTDGGAENLPNRGFSPYEFVMQGDEIASPFSSQEGVDIRQPMVTTSDTGITLYASRCEDRSPCSIIAADSKDGIHFEPTRQVCLDPAGLNHPYVARHNSQVHLWATRGQTQIVHAVLKKNGRCEDLMILETKSEAGTLVSLSAIEHLTDTRLFFARRKDGEQTAWFSQLMSETEAHPLTPCNLSSECWAQSSHQDGEFRLAESATGRTFLRGAFIGFPGRSGVDLSYRLSRSGLEWQVYPHDGGVKIPWGLTSITQVRFDGSFFMYGEFKGKIMIARNAHGQPSDSF